MSDLISRQAVLDEIHKYFRERIDHGIYEVDVVDCSAHISKRIDKLPTAFDVDNAVKQLETGLEEILYDRCYSNDYDMGMKEVNALLDKVVEQLKECERYVYDAVSDEDSYVIDTEKAISIVKGAVKE